MPSTLGKCHIRLAEAQDLPELERIFRAHEGVRIPPGYFGEFQDCLRDPDTLYFVGTVGNRIIGGGGITGYEPCIHASLAFGLVDPQECRKGYGTAILLARLLFVDPGVGGCQISLSATFWSAPFFARIGFRWHGDEEDESGNRFLYGSHMILPGDERIFRHRLAEGGVTLGFEPDRGRAASFTAGTR